VSLDHDTLQTWGSADEIEIETSRGEGAPVHRTTIWIVVDGDAAYVRSVRGPQGRWYREMLANPRGAIHAGGTGVPVQAAPVSDAKTVARVTELLTQKYQRRWPGPTASMLRPETLPTTLQLS
jgi:hypothetical protein